MQSSKHEPRPPYQEPTLYIGMQQVLGQIYSNDPKKTSREAPRTRDPKGDQAAFKTKGHIMIIIMGEKIQNNILFKMCI